MSYMNDGRCFLDSNVLVHANDSTDRYKQQIARKLVVEGIKNGTAVISAQVLSEFWVTVTRKIEVPLSEDDAEREVSHFCVMHVVEIDQNIVRAAIRFQSQTQRLVGSPRIVLPLFLDDSSQKPFDMREHHFTPPNRLQVVEIRQPDNGHLGNMLHGVFGKGKSRICLTNIHQTGHRHRRQNILKSWMPNHS